MFRKILSLLIVTALFLSYASLPTFAEGTNNMCGENLYWYFDESTETLRIEGSGSMFDYPDYGDTPWYSYRKKITNIEFPSEITYIGEQTFVNMTKLETLVIPASVENIGPYAFFRCRNLTDLTFLTGALTNISEAAFDSCESLKNLILPYSKSLNIGESAFADTVIEDLVIPCESVSIGKRAFYQDEPTLKTVTVWGDVEYIGNNAFGGYYDLPIGSAIIGETSQSSLESVTIKGNIKELDNNAFGGRTSLKEFTVQGGIDKIGELAFAGCVKLEKVTLKNYVTIEHNTFYDCTNLKTLIFQKDGEVSWVSDGEWLRKNENVTVYCTPNSFIQKACEIHQVNYKILGDINADGIVNATDIVYIVDAARPNTQLDAITADINCDGAIDLDDVTELKQIIANQSTLSN